MDTIKGLVLIGTFIGVLITFAMWVSLWDSVWRTAVEPTRAKYLQRPNESCARSLRLPSLIMVVVAVGGLSRDIGRAAWLLRPWELSLHHIVALVMSIEAKTQRVPRTWFERLKMWRHAYEAKVFDHRHEAVGRGPSLAAARDAALKRWNEQIERER